MQLKHLLFIFLVQLFTSCSRDHCNKVVITKAGTPCSQWGIKVDLKVYPADSIPEQFKQEGIVLCGDYELYQDPRMCACCGGTMARIRSLRYPGE